MNNLQNKNEFTSLELLEQINFFREQEGNKTELRHDTLLNIIRDEFSEEIGLQKILETPYIHPQNNQEYTMFILNLSQSRRVLIRESKFVRRKIIEYIEILEEKIKQDMLEEKKDLEQKLLGYEKLEKEVEELRFQNGNGKNLKAIARVDWIKDYFYIDKKGILKHLVKNLILLSNEKQIPYDSICSPIFIGEVYVFHTVIYDEFKRQLDNDKERKILPIYRKK